MLFFRKKTTQHVRVESGPEPGSGDGARDQLYRSYLNAWPENIRQQISRLQDLSGGTEGEFLSLGSQLHDFYARAVKISEISAEICDEVGETTLVEATHGLQTLTGKMTNLLMLMDEEAKRCREILSKTLHLTSRVDEPLAGFRKIMKVLHVLGISTKIESSRLSQLGTGFYSLANDVERLAVLIHEKSTNILGENVSLASRINDILSRVINNESTQYDLVATALNTTYANLTAINNLRGRYRNVAEVIASASHMVSQNISEVVTTMQFHDIVRQQMEHVQAALVHLNQRIGDESDQSDDAARLRLVTEVASVCQLQAPQLMHAKNELTTAVQSIVNNLNGIMDHQQLIAHKTGSVIHADGSVKDTPFEEVEKSVLIVADVVLESAKTTRELATAVDKVAQTVDVISTFVVDIENIGEEIKLIALNSQIRAAHTGTEGAALGVLAEAIQRLSVDACHQTVTVSDTLREVSHVTDELCKSDKHAFDNIEAETGNLTREIGELIGLLRRMNSSLNTNLHESDEAVQALVADIEGTTAGIAIHEVVEREIADIVSELTTILGQAKDVEPDLEVADMSQLCESYTLHSERRVHAPIAGAASGVEFDATRMFPPVISDGEDARGDNVELF